MVTQLAFTLARQYLRNPLLVALLIVVPVLFITVSYYTTEDVDLTFLVTEDGALVRHTAAMPEVHGAIMVPITAAFLAGIAGLFVMLESRRADARLVIAGVPAVSVGLARLAMIAVMALVVALVSVAVSYASSQPAHLAGFILANVLVSITYGFLGALVSLFVGRLGGAYLMLFIPMIDVGIFQDPMFISGEQSFWMKLLPGFGGTRFAVDAAFSTGADDWGALAAAVAWLVGLAAVTLAVIVRNVRR